MKMERRSEFIVSLRSVLFQRAAFLGCGFFWCLPLGAEQERKLSDFAQIYVGEFFPPEEDLLLNETGKTRSDALAHFAIGHRHELQGRADAATDAYLKVLSLLPEEYRLARKVAYLLAQSGRQDEALTVLETSLEKSPDQPRAHIALSEFLAAYYSNELEGRDRAVEVIENALRQFPGEPEVYEQLVKLYLVS
ncbi:MAG: tetratricopeptide repeat protein, partial [Verrucomicrobiota bacterium]